MASSPLTDAAWDDWGDCGLCTPHGPAMLAERVVERLTGRVLNQREQDALTDQLTAGGVPRLRTKAPFARSGLLPDDYTSV